MRYIRTPIPFRGCLKKKWPFSTISNHFFADHMNIFHKNLVQTVILKWLTCLNLDWIKGYNMKQNKVISFFLQFCIEKAWKFTTQKWPFYDPFWPFFCQLHQIFQKNWNSNGHFEVLSRSESQLDQRLWHNISSKYFFSCLKMHHFRASLTHQLELFQ